MTPADPTAPAAAASVHARRGPARSIALPARNSVADEPTANAADIGNNSAIDQSPAAAATTPACRVISGVMIGPVAKTDPAQFIKTQAGTRRSHRSDGAGFGSCSSAPPLLAPRHRADAPARRRGSDRPRPRSTSIDGI